MSNIPSSDQIAPPEQGQQGDSREQVFYSTFRVHGELYDAVFSVGPLVSRQQAYNLLDEELQKRFPGQNIIYLTTTKIYPEPVV